MDLDHTKKELIDVGNLRWSACEVGINLPPRSLIEWINFIPHRYHKFCNVCDWNINESIVIYFFLRIPIDWFNYRPKRLINGLEKNLVTHKRHLPGAL